MDDQLTIIAAGATSNPCLLLLDKKGYELFIQERDDKRCFYIAVKDKRRFVGDSAPEALGLVIMWEEMGDDWYEKLSDLPEIIPDEIGPEDED